MEREKFMQEARITAHDILEGKENRIMNLVQQAWAEGKRNAEVETLRAAIDEALDRREPKEPPVDTVYPTWGDWLAEIGLIRWEKDNNGVYSVMVPTFKMCTQIQADIAQKLGIESKEG